MGDNFLLFWFPRPPHSLEGTNARNAKTLDGTKTRKTFFGLGFGSIQRPTSEDCQLASPESNWRKKIDGDDVPILTKHTGRATGWFCEKIAQKLAQSKINTKHC
jgi:hypothetical protein